MRLGQLHEIADPPQRGLEYLAVADRDAAFLLDPDDDFKNRQRFDAEFVQLVIKPDLGRG
ncbi:hypothetical protein OG708_01115 [Streptomyces sp. NBC_01180]|nr:hypothetical protein OG452_33715 [Streptomyces sp. NBC_01197]WSS47355.1 hypothetical protein OG708_01115 [Streptomyces sp. NBC_01180]